MFPEVTATVVGDGPLRKTFEQQACDLRIDRNTIFVGYQRDIEPWRKQAKVFVLNIGLRGALPLDNGRDSCGLPAMLSRVGDLAGDGVNGYLAPQRAPETFAARFVDLSTDAGHQARFCQAAYRLPTRYGWAPSVVCETTSSCIRKLRETVL